MTAPHGFRREVQPYPETDEGTSIRMMAMPVDRPAEAPARPRTRRRRTPGHPSCERCQATRRGACADHRDYFHEYDPAASLPGHRTAGAEDGHVRDWRPV